MTQIVRYCGDCLRDRPFKQPHDQPGQCPDGPDGECPEWGCTACDAALLINVVAISFEPAWYADAGLRRRVA
jgi:hypothetical protein